MLSGFASRNHKLPRTAFLEYPCGGRASVLVAFSSPPTHSHSLPMMRHLFTLAGLVAFAATAPAADTGFLDRTYKDQTGTEFKYVLFVPHDYKKATPAPTILFLHGAGETKPKEGAKTKGTPRMPVEVGIGPAIKKREKTFPFITIIPQAPRLRCPPGG